MVKRTRDKVGRPHKLRESGRCTVDTVTKSTVNAIGVAPNNPAPRLCAGIAISGEVVVLGLLPNLQILVRSSCDNNRRRGGAWEVRFIRALRATVTPLL